MSTGLGVKGTVSRCFNFYQDFALCVKSSDDMSPCTLLRDDYMECLHGRKQRARAVQILEQAEANKAGGQSAHGHGGGHH
eukprot:gene9779-10815_t